MTGSTFFVSVVDSFSVVELDDCVVVVVIETVFSVVFGDSDEVFSVVFVVDFSVVDSCVFSVVVVDSVVSLVCSVIDLVVVCTAFSVDF